MSAPIIIVGATGAVGRALSQRLSRNGLPLHLVARDPQALAALADEHQASHAACDITDEDALQTALTTCPTEALAGLVFCVGSIMLKPLRRANCEDFMQTYYLNVVAAALAIKHCSTALKKGNGSIVLFSSVAATQGFHNHSVIASAKAAVTGLTVSLAAELAPHVRVNCIAPSLTDSAMAKPLTGNDKVAANMARQHPLGRLGQAEDHAALAAFLLSNDSGWITGQTLHVDGGRSTVNLPG